MEQPREAELYRDRCEILSLMDCVITNRRRLRKFCHFSSQYRRIHVVPDSLRLCVTCFATAPQPRRVDPVNFGTLVMREVGGTSPT